MSWPEGRQVLPGDGGVPEGRGGGGGRGLWPSGERSETRAAPTPRKSDKAVRNLTRTHRRALAELFNDTDFQNIFRRKEIYNQLLRAGDRLNVCNSTLLDIVVKLC
jgi:hypothetical protein